LHTIQLKDHKNKVFYDKLTYIYLELPKFNKSESELETNFDKWLYVLKRLPDLEKRPVALKEKVFQKLFEAAELAKFSKKEWEQYENSLKYYRDLKNVIDTAQDEGLKKGFEKGIEKGMEQGIKQGIEKGIEKAKFEMAIEMLKEGEAIHKISKYTGLTEHQVRAIASGES